MPPEPFVIRFPSYRTLPIDINSWTPPKVPCFFGNPPPHPRVPLSPYCSTYYTSMHAWSVTYRNRKSGDERCRQNRLSSGSPVTERSRLILIVGRRQKFLVSSEIPPILVSPLPPIVVLTTHPCMHGQ
ncbi:hypothetical protein CDAR_187271 [Caerostris darwini]|uniref:Uncharacterized protein n=1 Tax=Caerostris darwini TaxID=1538125 RepID=A0AAV4NEU4_9ARAC|nr:hypothetical protein CDAR_187271 [Caerostris darwini]